MTDATGKGFVKKMRRNSHKIEIADLRMEDPDPEDDIEGEEIELFQGDTTFGADEDEEEAEDQISMEEILRNED